MPTSQPETQSQPQQTNIDAAIRRAWRPLKESLIIGLFAFFLWLLALQMERSAGYVGGILAVFFGTSWVIALIPLILWLLILSFFRSVKVMKNVSVPDVKKKLRFISLTSLITILILTTWLISGEGAVFFFNFVRWLPSFFGLMLGFK